MHKAPSFPISIVTIKRLSGILIVLAIILPSLAEAWIIENKLKDGIEVYCNDCGSFGYFDKLIGINKKEACAGDAYGCGAGNGAQLNINVGICQDIKLGNRVNAQGRIVLHWKSFSIIPVPQYSVYTNEDDKKPDSNSPIDINVPFSSVPCF